jgi:hypothetical protein
MNKTTTKTSPIATAMADKLAKKKISLLKDESKKARLEDLVRKHEEWIAGVQSDIDLKSDEFARMEKIMKDAVAIDVKLVKVQEEILELVEKYNAIPWRPDMPWEEKIESSEYPKMIGYRDSLTEHLAELEKGLNRVYYRR